MLKTRSEGVFYSIFLEHKDIYNLGSAYQFLSVSLLKHIEVEHLQAFVLNLAMLVTEGIFTLNYSILAECCVK